MLYKLSRVELFGMLFAISLVSCKQKLSGVVPHLAASQQIASPLPAVPIAADELPVEQPRAVSQTVPLSSEVSGDVPGGNVVLQMASDLKPEFLMDARSHLPFVSLDAPQMAAASNAEFMRDQEHVLGITEGGESRAYPARFLAFHHVINDTIGVTPVAVTYCNVCDAGIRYDPRTDGHVLKFDFFGIYNGVVALCERQTQSVFLMAEGRFVTGPLTDIHIKAGDALDTTWEQWKRLHPDTLVMKPDARSLKYYVSPDLQGHRAYTEFPIPYFGASVTRSDKRLPAFDMVLGVTGRRNNSPTLLHRAYPLAGLERAGHVINDVMGGKPLAVFMDAHTTAAVALSRQLGARTLTFHARQNPGGAATFYDAETESRWNLEGKAEAGPLKGKILPRWNSHLSRWYGWYASYPDTGIYEHAD